MDLQYWYLDKRNKGQDSIKVRDKDKILLLEEINVEFVGSIFPYNLSSPENFYLDNNIENESEK